MSEYFPEYSFGSQTYCRKTNPRAQLCSSMLVVPKGKEDIRLVIDLRGPNQYIYRTPFSMPTLEQILAELDGATWFSTIDISNAFFHIELDEDSRHLTNFFYRIGNVPMCTASIWALQRSGCVPGNPAKANT